VPLAVKKKTGCIKSSGADVEQISKIVEPGAGHHRHSKRDSGFFIKEEQLRRCLFVLAL
jgi:hypothetical protein